MGRSLPCGNGLILPAFIPGPDTKLMQNSGRTKFKRTSIDRLMNTLVLWVGELLETRPVAGTHACFVSCLLKKIN